MKVLWSCAFAPEIVSRDLKLKPQVFGGWINGALEEFKTEKSVSVAVCFPQKISPKILKGSIDGIEYYGYPMRNDNDRMEYRKDFTEILHASGADLINLWGTEYAPNLYLAELVDNPQRMVCTIQGICTEIAKHYLTGIAPKDAFRKTFRDVLRKESLEEQKKIFEQRGKTEVEILKHCRYVIGRTEFDRACVQQLAPWIKYHFCGESLRKEFYQSSGTWSIDRCRRHSIFFGQIGYAIKGFHIFLEALPEIIRQYPDTEVYIAGNDPGAVPFYRISHYQYMLKQKIDNLGLKDRLHFLGMLSEEEICQEYLSANVFVCSSTIENSSNSISEAMMLGLPVVASYVGGTMSLLKDKEDGLLYQADAPYMLAFCVCRLFSDNDLCRTLGENAAAHAQETHNVEMNKADLMRIYQSVWKEI